MQLFYSPSADSDIITLDQDESRHCLKVLRRRVGDKVEVVDGRGALLTTEIVNTAKGVCELKVLCRTKDFQKKDFSVSIAIAPPKNIDRFEWFLEKATEIGIDNIYPLITEHSERTRLNIDRLMKILVSAMKQSGKAYLPVLHEARKFKDIFGSGVLPEELKFIAVCNRENLPHLKSLYQKGKDAVALIGPEGDFSNEEIEMAEASGFQPISLGPSRLRVETAGVVACYILNLMNE